MDMPSCNSAVAIYAQRGAGTVTKTALMGIAAIGHAVMCMSPCQSAVRIFAYRSAGAVAESAFMPVTAVSCAVMSVPSPEGAACLFTQRGAGTVTDTVFVIIATIGRTIMRMPSCNSTVFIRTYSTVSRSALPLLPVMMMSAAVMGRNRKRHRCCKSCGKENANECYYQKSFLPHGNFPFLSSL